MNRRCPKCESENVKPDTTETTSFSHGNISDWICNECGYRGGMPVENKERDNSLIDLDFNIDEIEKEVGKSDKDFYTVLIALLILLILPVLLFAYGMI